MFNNKGGLDINPLGRTGGRTRGVDGQGRGMEAAEAEMGVRVAEERPDVALATNRIRPLGQLNHSLCALPAGRTISDAVVMATSYASSAESLDTLASNAKSAHLGANLLTNGSALEAESTAWMRTRSKQDLLLWSQVRFLSPMLSFMCYLIRVRRTHMYLAE